MLEHKAGMGKVFTNKPKFVIRKAKQSENLSNGLIWVNPDLENLISMSSSGFRFSLSIRQYNKLKFNVLVNYFSDNRN